MSREKPSLGNIGGKLKVGFSQAVKTTANFFKAKKIRTAFRKASELHEYFAPDERHLLGLVPSSWQTLSNEKLVTSIGDKQLTELTNSTTRAAEFRDKTSITYEKLTADLAILKKHLPDASAEGKKFFKAVPKNWKSQSKLQLVQSFEEDGIKQANLLSTIAKENYDRRIWQDEFDRRLADHESFLEVLSNTNHVFTKDLSEYTRDLSWSMRNKLGDYYSGNTLVADRNLFGKASDVADVVLNAAKTWRSSYISSALTGNVNYAAKKAVADFSAIEITVLKLLSYAHVNQLYKKTQLNTLIDAITVDTGNTNMVYLLPEEPKKGKGEAGLRAAILHAARDALPTRKDAVRDSILMLETMTCAYNPEFKIKVDKELRTIR